MVLSITKLVKLLISKGFYPRSFFRIYKVCAFIEIISNKNGESYMIYIPSRYSFKVDENVFPNVYDLKTFSEDALQKTLKMKNINYYKNMPIQVKMLKIFIIILTYQIQVYLKIRKTWKLY